MPASPPPDAVKTPLTDLDRARAREAATREILEVISQSRDDDKPVFDVVLRKAAELCHASMASLFIISEDRSHAVMVAERGHDDGSIAFRVDETVWPLQSNTAVSTCLREGRITHVEDMADTDLYRSGDPIRTAAVDVEGLRTFLAVPLFSGGHTVACIAIYRREVHPFAPDEIALVETFAAQAVIAIENVRQFRELQDTLEQQKATSDILRVISQSRDDESRVFDLILEKAAVLCNADQGSLQIVNAARTHVRLMADWGHNRTAYRPGLEFSLDRPLSIVPTIRTGKVVHIEDYSQSDAYRDRDPVAVDLVEIEGVRTRLNVPLLQNGIAIGSISLSRRAVRAFSQPEIALVETFAAQAVIAIENVRQFRELQARLAREAATREILEVISQSRDDDAPVFDAVLRNANRLCGTSMAYLVLGRPDDMHMTLAAYVNPHLPSEDSVDQIIAFANQTRMRMDADEHFSARAIISGEVVQIADIAASPGYLSGEPTTRILVEDVGVRTILSVPLFDAQGTIGAISLQRREERLFSDDEITLIQSFAAQAVIAIENVRQFRELQTRLAREAATREILEVISQSRDDDKPVFDVVLRNAAELCHASMACLNIISEDRSHAVMVADWGNHGADQFPVGKTVWPLDANNATSTCLREGRIEHLEDMADTDLYRSGDPIRVAAVDADGLRTFLAVPLFSGDQTVACISIYRREVAPFTPDQIALVETFAAQAVIAIDNVRQFRELQTRLAREAATREILEVISRNPDDDRPVFDAILGNAIRLCGADTSALFLGRKDDPRLTLAAWRDRAAASSVMEDEMIARTNATPMRMDPTVHVSAQVIIEERNIHITDVRQHPSYLSDEPSYRIFGDALGIRSILVVPLIDARGALGVVQVHRRDVHAFSPDEIALVETFAAQAVIAIENVRQFKALEALNAELGDRVNEQVGEIERMGRLKRFLPSAVADAVVTSGSERLLSSHRALLGVLFCDIRGFTAFCETAEPEETIEVLQTYHEEMGRLINAHGAGVDHRMGDGIMVLFNDPLPCDDPAGNAVRLAMAMRAKMAELCVRWKRMGHRLGFGIGVSLGYATVGMVGSEGRFDYTASGTAINLASRLCDEAMDGEILLSPRACAAVEGDYTVESRGEKTFKGIREPLEVFCVTGVVGALPQPPGPS